MKRYLVFVGSTYYPSGGWKDYQGSLDTLEAALGLAANIRGDWWHIVDTEIGAVCKEGRRECRS